MTLPIFSISERGLTPEAEAHAKSLGIKRGLNVADMLWNANGNFYDFVLFRDYLAASIRTTPDIKLVSIDIEDPEARKDSQAIADAMAIVKAHGLRAVDYNDYSTIGGEPKVIARQSAWPSVSGYLHWPHERDPEQDWWTNLTTGYVKRLSLTPGAAVWLMRICDNPDHTNDPVTDEVTTRLVRAARTRGAKAIIAFDIDTYVLALGQTLPDTPDLAAAQCSHFDAIVRGLTA